MVRYEQSASNGSAIPNGKQPNGIMKEEQDTTNLKNWRLHDDHGCQTWHYLQSDEDVKSWPQSAADRYHLGLPMVCSHVQWVTSP